jgi:hypothetical protein
MAVVLSVSIPDDMHARWKSSGFDISPSAIFQNALESQLTETNQHLTYWSNRALAAEKKLKTIERILSANDKEIKKFLYFEDM